MNALELLEREQGRLNGDLAGLLNAPLADKQVLAKRMLERLTAYLLAEEKCLYPALYATLGSETPLEPLTDCYRLKSFVAELLRMDSIEASLATNVSNLQARLRGYGARQHSGLFPLMHGFFSPGELQLIGGEMQLFLATNRRVGSDTTKAKALVEALRELFAPSTQPNVHRRRRVD